MATSGSVDFQYTRTQLVERALRICGVLREGISATANQLTTSALALNGILKAAQTTGMPLWAIKKGAVFPIHDVSSVTLGASAGHAATTWTHTQLSEASAASDTTMVVDSITGISASDQIGIELDSGNIFWTTVSGAPSGSTVTLASGITTAAGVDSHVYVYTTKTVRPLKVIHATAFNYNTNTEREVNIISRDEYIRRSDKTTEGAITSIYYDPRAGNVLTGELHFYPRFPNGDETIQIWFQRPFEDMDSATDNLDFPQEWEESIVWRLAAVLMYEHGVPSNKKTMIQNKAIYETTKVEEFGQEEGSVYIQPARR